MSAPTASSNPQQAARIGSFYSGYEFDLRGLAALRPHLVEVGRACVDADGRKGAVIAMLWSGLVAYARSCGTGYRFRDRRPLVLMPMARISPRYANQFLGMKAAFSPTPRNPAASARAPRPRCGSTARCARPAASAGNGLPARPTCRGWRAHHRTGRCGGCAAVVGQMFYIFVIENLCQFGTLKALGTRHAAVLRMIFTQALVAGALGYSLVMA